MEANRKLRVYFDTTIPNMLFADDRPDWTAVTWRLWDSCAAGDYEVFVSNIFFLELRKTNEPKLSLMLEQLDRIEHREYDETEEVVDLARDYVSHGVLTQRRFNDCLHIAYAVINNCDVLLSWNMDDLAKKSRLEKVKIVNAISRYKEIMIVAPDEFLEGATDDHLQND